MSAAFAATYSTNKPCPEWISRTASIEAVPFPSAGRCAGEAAKPVDTTGRGQGKQIRHARHDAAGVVGEALGSPP